MEPFDDEEPNRRRKNPFDFLDDDDFERIFDEMQKMFESDNFKEIIGNMVRNGIDPNKRFVRGFSFHIGPDGKPRIEDFGNRPIKSPEGEPKISDEIEPLTDIIEGDNDVAVTVEIPGVEKEDIDLHATDDVLEITVKNHPERKYHKRLNLPCDVIPKTTKATYKNGILDVVIKRKEKKKPGEGYKVNVE
jgi:HSP20 family protein